MTRIMNTTHEDQYTFLIRSRSVLLTMRKISDTVVQNIKTPILCSVIFYFENRVLYEILWKNILQSDKPRKTIWRTASWVLKATNVHLEYIMLIGCPLQQWLHKQTLILRYKYIACLVTTTFFIMFKMLYNNEKPILVAMWSKA